MIGKTLKYMRKKKRLNQIDISNIINVARNTVSQYETETIQPTFEIIEKIADACDFDIYFVDRNTKEKFQANDMKRKDI